MAFDAALNAAIVSWARRQTTGLRHGNGECWTLAEAAVTQAGGVSSRPLTPHFGPHAAYVWGDVEGNPGNAQPGDIIQFIRHTQSMTVTIRDPLSGPQGRSDRGLPVSRNHHTAIILRIISPGQLFEILEQNVQSPPIMGVRQDPRVVQINRLALSAVTTAPQTTLNSSGDRETRTESYAVTASQVNIYHPRRRP